VGGQPKGETMGFADAIARKRTVPEASAGPVLLDVVTYRFSGHSPSDASSYRDASEMKLWQAQGALHKRILPLPDTVLKRSLKADCQIRHPNRLGV
jgi:hypothetical protein